MAFHDNFISLLAMPVYTGASAHNRNTAAPISLERADIFWRILMPRQSISSASRYCIDYAASPHDEDDISLFDILFSALGLVIISQA